MPQTCRLRDPRASGGRPWRLGDPPTSWLAEAGSGRRRGQGENDDQKNQEGQLRRADDDPGDRHAATALRVRRTTDLAQSEVAEDQREDRPDPVQPEDAEDECRDRESVEVLVR